MRLLRCFLGLVLLGCLAAALSGTQASLTWTGMGDNESAFLVERSLDGLNWVQALSVRIFGFNSLADRGTWQQENRLVGATAKLGTNSLGFEYKGQMWTNGYRAVDRTFRFATDWRTQF